MPLRFIAFMSIVGYVVLESSPQATPLLDARGRARLAIPQGAHGRARSLPPVTVLKPLCGAEPGLYEHLRSFCRQDYPEFQIVFGVRDPDDPALRAWCNGWRRNSLPLPIDVVINPQQHGSNRKISNLINMLRVRAPRRARHGGQRRLRRHRLSRQRHGTAARSRRGPGHLSVPRRADTARSGRASAPCTSMSGTCPPCCSPGYSAIRAMSRARPLCMRRDTLQAIGGLRRIANHLADDHRLGELVRATGTADRVVSLRGAGRAPRAEPRLARSSRAALDAHHPRAAAAQFPVHLLHLQRAPGRSSAWPPRRPHRCIPRPPGRFSA